MKNSNHVGFSIDVCAKCSTQYCLSRNGIRTVLSPSVEVERCTASQVPQLLRQRIPDGIIGWFLHTPWPTSEAHFLTILDYRLLEKNVFALGTRTEKSRRAGNNDLLHYPGFSAWYSREWTFRTSGFLPWTVNEISFWNVRTNRYRRAVNESPYYPDFLRLQSREPTFPKPSCESLVYERLSKDVGRCSFAVSWTSLCGS